jgi:hypothetical protein
MIAGNFFVCDCGHKFKPEGTAKVLLYRVLSGDMQLAMIECPSCHGYTPVEAPKKEQNSDENFRCPVETCSGWVCEVDGDDSTFFGCGECGNVWPGRRSLYEAISEIVKNRKYRRKVYVKVGDDWKPAQLNKEPRNYEELVQKEWDDQ